MTIKAAVSRCADCGNKILPDRYGNGAVCRAHPGAALVPWPTKCMWATAYLEEAVCQYAITSADRLNRWLDSYDESLWTGVDRATMRRVAAWLVRWDLIWGPRVTATSVPLYGRREEAS